MSNVISMPQNINSDDIMTTGETAKMLRCCAATVRSLTEREWHPLPCINRGMAHKKQRIFLRSSVLRWMQEEEKTAKPVQAERPAKRQKAG